MNQSAPFTAMSFFGGGPLMVQCLFPQNDGNSRVPVRLGDVRPWRAAHFDGFAASLGGLSCIVCAKIALLKMLSSPSPLSRHCVWAGCTGQALSLTSPGS